MRTTPTPLRVDAPTMARLDRLVAIFTERAGGIGLNRSDVMRRALMIGLEQLEGEVAGALPKAPRSRKGA